MTTAEQVQEFCDRYVVPPSRFLFTEYESELEVLLLPIGFQLHEQKTGYGFLRGYMRQRDGFVDLLVEEDIFAQHNFETQHAQSAHSFSLIQLPQDMVDDFYARNAKLYTIQEDEGATHRDTQEMDSNREKYLKKTKRMLVQGLAFVAGTVVGLGGIVAYHRESYELGLSALLAVIPIVQGIRMIRASQRRRNDVAEIDKLRETLKSQYQLEYAEFRKLYEPFTVFDKQAIETAAGVNR